MTVYIGQRLTIDRTNQAAESWIRTYHRNVSEWVVVEVAGSGFRAQRPVLGPDDHRRTAWVSQANYDFFVELNQRDEMNNNNDSALSPTEEKFLRSLLVRASQVADDQGRCYEFEEVVKALGYGRYLPGVETAYEVTFKVIPGGAIRVDGDQELDRLLRTGSAAGRADALTSLIKGHWNNVNPKVWDVTVTEVEAPKEDA